MPKFDRPDDPEKDSAKARATMWWALVSLELDLLQLGQQGRFDRALTRVCRPKEPRVLDPRVRLTGQAFDRLAVIAADELFPEEEFLGEWDEVSQDNNEAENPS